MEEGIEVVRSGGPNVCFEKFSIFGFRAHAGRRGAWTVSVTLLAVCAGAGTARGDALVQLRLADFSGNPVAAPNAGGTWNGGESVLVEMWLGVADLPNFSGSLLLRSAQVNYRATTGLELGRDIAAQGSVDGIGNFWFDYSSLPGGAFPAGSGQTGAYLDLSNVASGNPPMPAPPSTVYAGLPGGSMISLPAVQSPGEREFVRLGAMAVTLPAVQGVYVLDLLHTGVLDDFNEGTTITFGFGGAGSEDPFTIWSTATDDTRVRSAVAYAEGFGPATFVVVPEPMAIALLSACVCVWGLSARRGRLRKSA